MPKRSSGAARPAHQKPDEPRASFPHRRRVMALLFLALTLIYFCNFRLRGAGDSLPTRVLPFSILREANLDLNEFTWASSPERGWPYYIHGKFEGDGFRFYSVSSIATAVVVTPLYLAPTAWLAWNDISYDDARARVVMVLMEKLSAALLTAMSAALLFLALSGMTTRRWALALTLVYALGTSTWSISSQALWSHALSELCLAALFAILVHRHGSKGWGLAAAIVAVLMVWNRPQMAIFAAVLFVYAVSRDRRAAIPLFGLAFVSGALLLAYNIWALGNPAGGYGSFGHFSHPLLKGMAGLMISPNRGLFIYTPIAIFSAWGAVQIWRRDAPAWLRMMTVGLAGHVILYSKFDEWWAGYSYGPRYFSDVQPLLVVLLVYGLVPYWRLRSVRAGALLCVAYGVFVQAVGVYAEDDGWNRDPISVDTRPERVWDWGDTQIRRAMGNGFRGFELLPVLVDTFRDDVPARLVELNQADLASRVEMVDMPAEIRAGYTAAMRVKVTNIGSAAWPMFSGKGLLDIRHLVFVVQSWKLRGQPIAGLGEVVLLPENLAPGESREMELPLTAPPQAGEFDVEVRVTQAIDGQRGTPSPNAATARLRVRSR